MGSETAVYKISTQSLQKDLGVIDSKTILSNCEYLYNINLLPPKPHTYPYHSAYQALSLHDTRSRRSEIMTVSTHWCNT